MSSQTTLLALLRIAITGKAEAMPVETDWSEVLTHAALQGVRGLVLEALETIKGQGGVCLPSKMMLLQLYAQTLSVEKHFDQHKALAQGAAEMWRSKGIRTIVFKGLAHSRYYTQPKHREFGDFDCYLIDAEGRCAYAQGNEAARQEGLTVDDGWYKHSHIAYMTLTIENHQFFTAARRGGTDKALNKYIVDAIGDGSSLEPLGETGLYVLPLMAEGLFMLYHSLMHFLVEGINMRHFTDWAYWMKANQDKIEWGEFYGLCKRFRLAGFVDVMNTISAKFLGVELHDESIYADSPYAERTIESALYDNASIYSRSKGRWYERVSVVRNAFKYSWKYREVALYSMIGYVWAYVYGFLRRGEEE